LLVSLLLEADSAAGASVGTGAALGAFVGVDAVDVALRDSANGTFVDAGAACNAVITNYVSHSINNLKFKINSTILFSDLAFDALAEGKGNQK